ncbi:MAG: ABC transporter permease [Gammaproteobacteria bacterium]|nr:ABC transporter permease [Gammaproteobacteria bacterium]
MSIEAIPIGRLLLAFIPTVVVIAIMHGWGQRSGRAVAALGRMLAQLIAVGFVLVFVFESHSGLVILSVLAVMAVAAGWLALNTVEGGRRALFPASVAAVVLGGTPVVVLVTQGILRLDPWFRPNYLIPLAGMVYAQSMTGISLASERLRAESGAGKTFEAARDTAYRAAMIPVINSLLSVGIIFLPGMMTGQILAGVSPLLAVRYQVMVMCMIFGATGLSTALFLLMIERSARLRAVAVGATVSSERG